MNDEKPLISIIVPIYNVENYLRNCVDSIINQTYQNLEIILIDDGSTDNSGHICDEYVQKDNRIVVIHQKNSGVSVARNVGIHKASGEWICFIDSDDWIEKEFIEILLENANQYHSDVAFCGYHKIYEEKKEKINSDGEIKKYSSNEFLVKVLNVQTSYGFVHMKLIKKSVLDGILFDKNLIVAEDALLNIKLCENASSFLLIPQALYNYRINPNSVVRRFDTNYDQKYLNAMIAIRGYLEEKYSGNKEIEQNFYNFVIYHVMLIAVNYCFHPKNADNHLKLLKKVCNEEIFKEAIRKSNYNELSITRKITLFTIKHKLYLLTALICKIRQAQIK